MRVIVTGSRDWEDWSYIWEVLNKTFPAGEDNVLVHGDCPTGADHHADVWARTQPDITIERHPADWNRYGRAAGPRRNKEMVGLGADLCHAFIKNNSRGASGTAKLAEDANIKTERHTR